jgi:hypothetical protein
MRNTYYLLFIIVVTKTPFPLLGSLGSWFSASSFRPTNKKLFSGSHRCLRSHRNSVVVVPEFLVFAIKHNWYWYRNSVCLVQKFLDHWCLRSYRNSVCLVQKFRTIGVCNHTEVLCVWSRNSGPLVLAVIQKFGVFGPEILDHSCLRRYRNSVCLFQKFWTIGVCSHIEILCVSS